MPPACSRSLESDTDCDEQATIYRGDLYRWSEKGSFIQRSRTCVNLLSYLGVSYRALGFQWLLERIDSPPSNMALPPHILAWGQKREPKQMSYECSKTRK